MSDIVLTIAARRSIRDINGFDELLARTQQRLTTSKKVNGVIDNAEKFFGSRDFLGVASNYDSYIENTSKGIDTIQVAADALDAIERLSQQVRSLILSAKATPPNRASLFDSIAQLLTQIELVVQDANYETANLLDNNGVLEYRVGNLTTSIYEVQALNLIQEDLGDGGLISTGVFTSTTPADVLEQLNVLSGHAATTAFTDSIYLESHFDKLASAFGSAVDRSRASGQTFATSVAVLQIRQRFNKAYQTVNQAAAERLVAADLNEEGANLVTLQTRRELGIEALASEGRNVRLILNLLR